MTIILFTCIAFAISSTPPDEADPASPDEGNSATGESNDTKAVPEITKMPKLVKFVEAEYPAAAMAAGIEAEVTLEIDIDATGQVEAATVIVPAQESGHGFDQAAMLAVQMFEFEPAFAGDEPIPVRITYKYRFALATPEPKQTSEPTRDPVANLKGRLIERGTRMPLAGVLVTVFREVEDGETAGFEALTDIDGTFIFYDLAAGTWKILVDPEGYYPVRTNEEVVAGELTEVVYYVERGSYNPFDILVVAKRVRKEVSRTTLAIEEVEKVPGTFGDVLNVVQNLPGVARTGLFDAGFAVRGSAPEDTRILLDGTEVPLIYHFGGLRTVIPNGMIGSVDFYPGNFPNEFSRATGGILDVGLKKLRPEALGGYADINLWDSSLYLEAPLGDKGAIAIGGRRSYIDVLAGPIAEAAAGEEDNIRSIALPRYWDTQVLANYRPANGHELQAFFLYSDDAFKVLFGNEEDELEFSLKMRFYRSILEYSYVPAESFQNVLKISQGHNWTDLRLGDDFRMDDDFDMVQVRDTARWQIWDKVLLATGLDYLWSTTDSRIIVPPDNIAEEANSNSDIVDAAFHSVGLFTELELTPLDGLLVIPGVRFDYFERVDSSRAAPRLTTRYNLNDQWVLKGGAGYFFQEPMVNETSENRGNPDLGPEQAMHLALGAEFKPLEYLTFDVTGFYKHLRNLVVRSDDMLEQGDEVVPRRYSNKGKGKVYGLEVLLRHEFANNFFGWLSYTLSVSKRRDETGDDYRLFDYDQTHILTLVGSYRLPRNWEIGVRWRLVSGNPTTPVVGTVVDADWDYYVPTYGDRNSGRLPPFHQLDVRVDKRWIYDNWTLSVYLDIQNIYDRQNPESIEYKYDYTEQTYSGGLPILGILGVKGEF
ncbi:MAG: hypothetical protein DRQ56_02795 [Gammaproteobacteria bacterium]|nr:MAG: hypothetical protein DRQ56_02795 [Gammaproteobacteria bacterium]